MRHDSRQAGSRRSPDSQTPASSDVRTNAGRAGGGSQKKAGAQSLRCEATRRRMTRRFNSFPYAEPSDLQPVVVGPILMCIDVV